MIDILNNDTGKLVGAISEAELELLIAAFEEESGEDQDYYITADTIEMIADGTATDHLLEVLRSALGKEEGVEIRWQKH